MNLTNLSQIENRIIRLSREEQLWLAERIIHRMQNRTSADKTDSELQIAAMAEDPEILKELRKIETEFMITESDGLEEK